MGLLTLLTDPKNFKFYNGGQGYTGDGSVPNLKNLHYGKDRIDGGSSNQPYIQTPIPDGTSTLGILNNDFIWRGGIGAPLASEQDVVRLSKMFTDTKTPNGLFFITKQETLSRSAVRTQTSPNGMNGGVYSPLNTLAQAGVVAFGGHLNKQGLNPFQDTGISATTNENLYSVKVTPQQTKPNNRLVQLYTAVNNNLPFKLNGFTLNNGVNVLSYSGGPDSNLGVGKTNIRYINNIGRTGINNYQYTTKNTPSSYFWGTKKKIVEPNEYLKNLGTRVSPTVDPTGILPQVNNPFNMGASGKYFRLTQGLTKDIINNGYSLDGNPYGTNFYSVYEPAVEGNTWPANTPLINAQGTYTYNQEDIINTPSTYKNNGFSPQTQDFRAVLRNKTIAQQGVTTKTNAIKAGQLALAPDYTTENIEQRVLLGDPGARADHNYSNYTDGVRDNTGASIYPTITQTVGKEVVYSGSLGLDRINAFPVYYSENVESERSNKNDLVKFRIAIIDNNYPAFKTFIHFRALLGSISDSYNATWNPVQYLGRGENFYTYNGFTRQVSLSWTVAAQSKEELVPMYKKLNWLASSLTPDYSPNGYMRGNLAQLTIGGYLYEVPGIITNLTYEMDESTPWEIGLNSLGGDDSSVKELAHIIRVTSFNFIPIHTFRPETATPGRMNNHQQYISLANGQNVKNNLYGMLPYLSPGELYE
jgi:hypothetical protein